MIEIIGFTKYYDEFCAVEDLNLAVGAGEIFGLVGPNGAGKSTTLRFLATLLKPTGGHAIINGFNVARQVREIRRSMGYMPDSFGVYDGMKVWEYLDFFACCYDIPYQRRVKLIDDILVLLDLGGKRHVYVNGLSRGMRQRLGLAKSLIHDPPVLLLDEPASGLDPRARTEMVELLNELRNMGKTIMISSHILPELARCCTSLGIMERGKLVASGTVEEIKRIVSPDPLYVITALDGGARLAAALKSAPDVGEVSVDENIVTFPFRGTTEEAAGLLRRLVLEGIPIASFRRREVTLEEAFLTATKGEVQ